MSAGQCLARRRAAAHLQFAARRQLRTREQRGEERRHAVEDRRLVLAQPREHRLRRRPLCHQHGRRADRQRKREAVAEPVGEEELRRGEDDVVLADPEDRFRVELRRLDQARLDVDGALRRAGRARRVEPETRVVARRVRGLERGAGRGHQLRERVMRTLRQPPDTMTWRRCGQLPEERRERRQERRRHDQRAGAAVAQHVVVVLRREQRVAGDRNDAGLDAAQERGRKIDRVEQAQEHALLGRETEMDERIGAAVHALRELAVGVRAAVVDVGGLVRAAGGEVALDQVVRRVVVARDLHQRRAQAMVGPAQGRHMCAPPAPVPSPPSEGPRCSGSLRFRELDRALRQQVEHPRLAAGDGRHVRGARSIY